MSVVMFPGQGSQKIGMGSELFERYPDVVATADHVLGYSIKELCELDNERLSNTKFTQPALFVVNHLSYLKFVNEKSSANYFIGHSLGEYNALVAAGAISFQDGLMLVKERGRLMSEVSNGGMCAIIGMDINAVQSLLDSDEFSSIDLANINAPNQVVVSGPIELMDEISDAAKKAGAKMAIKLNVSGAFHSRYMKDVGDVFSKYINEVFISNFDQVVIANVTATPYKVNQVKDLLKEQMYSSVQWVKTIHYLQSKGETDFIEVGPGRVLSGLLRHINR